MKIKNHLYIATLITLAIGSLSGCFYCVPLLIASLLSAVIFRGLRYWISKDNFFNNFENHIFLWRIVK
jgi:hypothetical protein